MAKGQKSKRIMEIINNRKNDADLALKYVTKEYGYTGVEYEKALSRCSMMDNLIKEIENEGLA